MRSFHREVIIDFQITEDYSVGRRVSMKTVIVIMLLIIIGAGGFYLGQQYKLVPVTPATNTVPATSVTITPPPTVGPTTTAAPAQTNMQELTYEAAQPGAVMTAVTEQLNAKYGNGSVGTMSVTKIEGNYAKGMVNGQGGGGMWFAAKVNDIWQLVWDGNGIIQCSDLTNYSDFPKTMIPECYNTATQKMVVR